MKLRALRLHGFKSFADRTEVVFHDGMTAVVGPNGCGKSNISDAIRWVLGEQRPTAIRGAKMEEAIFQGTIDRRPVNRGSVSIEVSNDDGALPVPFTEVEITRTVYRDGGSDYFLNRSPCRLRDIQDLCRDTGLGANAYSIIENRMIDAILSERADERRGLFEEAAGIGKYKDRRKEATRRLERAQVDLQRLEDLIAEVQSKVRSLARQKGAAERYVGLRKRRLDLEMSIARGQLGELGARLREVRSSLAGEVPRDETLRAKVSETESRLETLRLEHVAVEKTRNAAAGRLEEARSLIGRWERDLAVAEERAAHAERRLTQIGEERGRATAEIAESTELKRQVELGREDLLERKTTLVSSVTAHADRSEAARSSLATARAAVSEIEARERDVARRIAQLRGNADAAEARSLELEERIAHLTAELHEARQAAEEAALQGDLFTDRMEALGQAVSQRKQELEVEAAAAEAAREALEEARTAERAEKERLGALSARWAALSEMERAREGVDPVLKALLKDPPKGVHGILADFLAGEPEDAATLESVLGVFLRAVVVEDSATAHELARWFREEWSGGGGLVVLPLDRVPDVEADGDLIGRVRAHGAGALWVRALLSGFKVKDEPGRGSSKKGRAAVRRVVRGGGWVESGGAIHLGNPMGSTGILERRRELAALGKAVQKAEATVSESSRAAAEAATRAEGLDRALAERRGRLQEAEDAHREARSDLAERSTSRVRMERLVEETTGRLDTARSALDLARARSDGSRTEGEGLRAEDEALKERRDAAVIELGRVEAVWEEVRDQTAKLEIERSGLDADLTRADERARDLERLRSSLESRLEALAREEESLVAERERSSALASRGKEEVERLFESREVAETELKEVTRALEEFQETISEAERRVREARNQERSAAEERHALELEEHEVRARVARIQERLEGEWGRPLDRLLDEAEPVDLDEDALRKELGETVVALDRLGPVNMLAVEEHEEESARLTFLTGQRDDLVRARDDLGAAIREINATATSLFTSTFEAIRANFRETFFRLFEGGECDLWLANPDDPLESEIEIHAAPRGKRTQRIDLLSGGERALTALSLLFGIYLVKPSPFCVLDEVDAPLDESNIGRFIRLLHEFKRRSQFIVITHNPKTIEAADWIYGVTMEEPGVSSIVGVRLEPVPAAS